jgi:hypothetical protein
MAKPTRRGKRRVTSVEIAKRPAMKAARDGRRDNEPGRREKRRVTAVEIAKRAAGESGARARSKRCRPSPN